MSTSRSRSKSKPKSKSKKNSIPSLFDLASKKLDIEGNLDNNIVQKYLTESLEKEFNKLIRNEKKYFEGINAGDIKDQLEKLKNIELYDEHKVIYEKYKFILEIIDIAGNVNLTKIIRKVIENNEYSILNEILSSLEDTSDLTKRDLIYHFIFRAAEFNNYRMLEYLLDKYKYKFKFGASDITNIIIEAIMYENNDIVKKLLKKHKSNISDAYLSDSYITDMIIKSIEEDNYILGKTIFEEFETKMNEKIISSIINRLHYRDFPEYVPLNIPFLEYIGKYLLKYDYTNLNPNCIRRVIISIANYSKRDIETAKRLYKKYEPTLNHNFIKNKVFLDYISNEKKNSLISKGSKSDTKIKSLGSRRSVGSKTKKSPSSRKRSVGSKTTKSSSSRKGSVGSKTTKSSTPKKKV